MHEFATALMMISTYDCRQEELDLPELIKDPQIRKKIKLVDKTFDGFMLNLLINDYDLTNYSTFKDTLFNDYDKAFHFCYAELNESGEILFTATTFKNNGRNIGFSENKIAELVSFCSQWIENNEFFRLHAVVAEANSKHRIYDEESPLVGWAKISSLYPQVEENGIPL